LGERGNSLVVNVYRRKEKWRRDWEIVLVQRRPCLLGWTLIFSALATTSKVNQREHFETFSFRALAIT
jgi:hypothetical protein